MNISKSKKGFTFVEMMIASTIMIFVLASLAYITIFTSKSVDLLYTQMSQQVKAVRSVQTISDILRNAYYTTVTPQNTNGLEVSSIDFKTIEDSSITSRIALVNNDIYYYKDVTNLRGTRRLLAEDVESLSFINPAPFPVLPAGTPTSSPSATPTTSPTPTPTNTSVTRMIQIKVKFLYRKYKGYNTNKDEKLDGTFLTAVYMRN